MKGKYNRSIRRTRLTQALALALGMGVTAAMAGPLPGTNFDQSRAEALYQQHFGSLDGFDAYLATVLPQKSNDKPAAPAAVRTISNCNNSGTGSFRSAVAAANSGDIIDLSGCTTGQIVLASTVTTALEDLTIRGINDSVGTILSGNETIRPLGHTGTGTLRLERVQVTKGKLVNGVARGGCISSFGNVELVDSAAKYCEVSLTSGTGTVRGGAIYAAGSVALDNSTVKESKANTSVAGVNVFGGGIYARNVSISGSTISNNSASTINGIAKGGGLSLGEANTGTNITVSMITDSTITGNLVSALNEDVHSYGGGIFAKRTNLWLVDTKVTNNKATKYGEGGGVFVSALNAGATTVKYGSITGNEAAIGGGINSRAGVTLTSSTVANNKATTAGGVLASGGTTTISRSTISGNTATNVAGAQLQANSGNSIVIKQSTISDNMTDLNPNSVSECPGTGLRLESNASIQNSTIVLNINDQGSVSSEFCGGVGMRLAANVQVDMSSTLVAHNFAQYAATGYPIPIRDAQNIRGTGTSVMIGDHNAIGMSPGFVVPSDTIHIGNDYQVEVALANNGGPTKTHMPLLNSLLIDTGAANTFETDQRGDGFPRVTGAAADIGAVESIGNAIFSDDFE